MRSIAGAGDLGGDVRHVPGREELALLDVDRRARLARGEQQVGLAAEEGRDLQHVHRLRGRRALRALVHVGQHRQAEALRARRPGSRGPRPCRRRAPRRSAGAVGLVEAALVDQRHAGGARDRAQRVGHFQRVRRGFDLARPAIRTKRQVVADRDAADPRPCAPSDKPRLLHRRRDEARRTAGAARTASISAPGWYCTPTNQGCSGYSMISGSTPSGDMPENRRPGALQPLAVMDVDLVAVAVALLDRGRAVVDRRAPAMPAASIAG